MNDTKLFIKLLISKDKIPNAKVTRIFKLTQLIVHYSHLIYFYNLFNHFIYARCIYL